MWFMEVMPKMLADLKKDLRGCPSQFTIGGDGKEYQSVDEGVRDWENILDRMIFCFQEMNEDTCSMKNEYEEEYHRQRFESRGGKSILDCFTSEEINEHGEKRYRLITGEAEPELEEKYRRRMREIEDYRENMKNEGFELFRKYFWNLWS